MKSFIKNSSGFNLVQMMVALGLTGFIGVIAFQQIHNTQKQVSNFEKKSGLDHLIDNVAKRLSKKNICEHNFASGTPANNDNIY